MLLGRRIRARHPQRIEQYIELEAVRGGRAAVEDVAVLVHNPDRHLRATEIGANRRPHKKVQVQEALRGMEY